MEETETFAIHGQTHKERPTKYILSKLAILLVIPSVLMGMLLGCWFGWSTSIVRDGFGNGSRADVGKAAKRRRMDAVACESKPTTRRPVPPRSHTPPLIRDIHNMVYDGNKDPFSILSADAGRYKTDHSYGSSSMDFGTVDTIMAITNATFWLEVGSFIGNSAITTAKALKRLGYHDTGVVCIDPFTGDVNMLSTLKDQLLHMDQYGHPRIYETFLANVQEAGQHDMILPIRATAIVGMRLLKRLKTDGMRKGPRVHKLHELPQVIYLDSAHEYNETFIELETAWDILAPGGVLCGDDYSIWWPAVKHDVNAFAKSKNLKLSDGQKKMLSKVKRVEEKYPGVGFIYPTWFILKPLT